jgi:hypothetical protein
MVEDELLALAERIAPPVRPDLADVVLARLDQPETHLPWRPALAAGLAALVAAFAISDQVRAVAADLVGIAGIEVSWGEPEAASTPEAPLPGSR